MIGRGWAKYRDLQVAGRTLISRSRSLRQIIDRQDTDNSLFIRYFTITEFNNCFIIRSPSMFFYLNPSLPAQGSNLPFSHKSLLTITHEQNIIFRWYYVWADQYLYAVICRSRGGLSADEKDEKIHRMITWHIWNFYTFLLHKILILHADYIYVICRHRVDSYSEKLWPRFWKCCPRPVASGSIFKPEVTDFHYTDRPYAGKWHVYFFFPAVNWFYRSQMGLFTQLLSLARLARRLLTICKKSWQRARNSDSSQQRCIKEQMFLELLYVSCIYFTG